MRKLIGIAGRKRAGKDTLALALKELIGGTIRPFAAPLHSFMQQWIDPAMKATYGPDFDKEAIIKLAEGFEGCSYRNFMQAMGTEGIRSVYPEFFIHTAMLFRSTAEFPIIIPDVRREDEAQAIKDRDGIIILVNPGDRLPPSNDTHSSEVPLSSKYIDYLWRNDVTTNVPVRYAKDWLAREEICAGPA